MIAWSPACLCAHLQGDVVEIPLSPLVAQDASWVATFAQALLLGRQLELVIDPHEPDYFVRQWQDEDTERHSLVFYDTMPGGAASGRLRVRNRLRALPDGILKSASALAMRQAAGVERAAHSRAGGARHAQSTAAGGVGGGESG